MILNFLNFLYEYGNVNIKPAKKVLSDKKFKHSKRVAELTKILKDENYIYSAAIYHDFLERGGTLEELKNLVPKESIEIIEILTNDTDESTILKLKSKLEGKSINVINDVLLIKLCDRCDNLKIRYNNKELKSNYIDKSAELIQWIYQTYSGDKLKLKQFLQKEMITYVPIIILDL